MSDVDRFLAAINRRESRHTVEGPQFVAMLWRMLRALEVRAIDDPELLPQIVELAHRLDEMVNVAISANADRYAIDPRRGMSAAECGRILGASKQAASQRRARGREVMMRRIDSAGVVHFSKKGRKISSETARELDAIEQTERHAAVSLEAWRARKAS